MKCLYEGSTEVHNDGLDLRNLQVLILDHDVMLKLPYALQLRTRSEEDADDELLSVAVVKDGNKAVVGAGTGVLSLYSWGYFNDCSDRFPGEPRHNRVVYGRLLWCWNSHLRGAAVSLGQLL